MSVLTGNQRDHVVHVNVTHPLTCWYMTRSYCTSSRLVAASRGLPVVCCLCGVDEVFVILCLVVLCIGHIWYCQVLVMV